MNPLQSEKAEEEESSTRAIKRNATDSSPSCTRKKRKEGHNNTSVSPEHVGSSSAVTKDAGTPQQPMLFDTALETLTPIERIIRSGVWWGGDANTIVQALSTLSDALCQSDDRNADNCTQAAEAGVGPILVGVMRKWHHHEDLVGAACRVLVSLTCHGALPCAKKQGIIDTVVWALQEYPEPSHLQTSGFKTLSNLCNKKKEDAVYIVQKLKFLSVAERIFTKHRENPSLVDRVTVLLKFISHYEELHEHIIEARGVPILAEALYFYRHDTREENKKHLAKAAIKKLCKSDAL